MTNKKDIYLTAEGVAKLRADLETLKGPRRDEIARRLRHAVQQGDLSENADYIVAKEEQAFLEGRIQELENVLREAIIVEETGSSDRVTVGSTVVVSEDGREAETWQLVGIKESDPRHGKISHESPIGQALLGKGPGAVVEVSTPGGKVKLKILEVR